MNTRFWWGALIVVGVLLEAPQAMAAKIDAKHLIVPGKAIGQIHLNMSRSEVNKRLGNPSSLADVTQDFSFAVWEKKHIFVGFDGNNIHNKVVLINVWDKNFQTANGTKVGQKISQIKKRYSKGRPMPGQNIAEWHDDHLGIGFLHRTVGTAHVNPHSDWVCDEISVFAAIKKK